MDDLDLVWNAAGELGAEGEAPGGTPQGITNLSYLLRLYNSTMGGGLGFAFEVNEKFRIQRAINAMGYFGLSELADFFEDLLEHFPDYDYIEAKYAEYEALVGTGDVIEDAFRAKAGEAPDEFGVR